MDGKGGCNTSSSFMISFDCSACSNGQDCTYTLKQNDFSFTGCTNSDDKIWVNFKSLLDGLYLVAKQTDEKYDWCASSCVLSTGAIVGIVIGVVVGMVVLVVGVHLFLKRRRRLSDGYLKHSSSLITLAQKTTPIKFNL